MSDVERSLETALAEARTALVEAERVRASWELRAEQLRTEVTGLEAAVERRRQLETLRTRSGSTASAAVEVIPPGTVATRQIPGRPDWPGISDLGSNGVAAVGVAMIVIEAMKAYGNWQQKKRVAAVEGLLEVARRPVHRSEIALALLRLGRTSDSLDHVSAALAHLKREGRAHPVGSGYWEVGPTPIERNEVEDNE